MILQQTRLRLTEAIYFGKAPGGGASNITDGNGITNTPNPIVGVGTISLGPLTSDWNGGNFNAVTKNSDDVVNVRVGGCNDAGVVNNTPTFQAIWNTNQALNLKPDIFFPSGNYNFDSALNYPIIDTAGGHALWRGEEAYRSRIKVSQVAATPFLTLSPVSGNFKFQRLIFVDNGSNATAAIEITNGGNYQFEDCYFSGFPKQIRFTMANVAVFATFNRCTFDGPSIACVEAIGNAANIPTVFIFRDCSFVNGSPTNSVVFKGSAATQAATLIFENCVWEVSGPVAVDNVAQVLFIGSHSEAQKLLVATAVNGPVKNLQVINTVASATADAHLPLISLTGVNRGNINNTQVIAINPTAALSAITIDATCVNVQEEQTFQTGTTTLVPLVSNLSNLNYGVGTFNPGALTGPGVYNTIAEIGTGVAAPSTVTLELTGNRTTDGRLADLSFLNAAVGGTTNLAAVGIIRASRVTTNDSAKLDFITKNAGTFVNALTVNREGSLQSNGLAAPPVSAANTGTLYFDSALNKYRVSMNGAAYVDLVGSGGVTGSGVAGKLTYWTGATALTDEPNITLGGTYTLDVTGDINLGVTANVYRIATDRVLGCDGANGILAVGPGVSASLGIGSTGVGANALLNATGIDNTAVGNAAAASLVANGGVTAVGTSALNLTTGGQNTAIGGAAGATNTTGAGNVFVGSAADATAGNLTNAVAIGANAVVAANDSMQLGNAAMKVGIRTGGTPHTALDVGGQVSHRMGTVAVVNGLNSNIATPDASFVRLTGPTAGFSIGGFTGGFDGNLLTVYNTVAFQMTIVNEDGASTAVNRIKTLTGGNVVLRAGTSSASFVYDTTDDRWILVGSN